MLLFNAGLYILWLYLPVLGGGYVWDDLAFLRDALNYTPGASLETAVFSGSNFYRPVGYFSFVLEAHLVGVDPLISHAVNVGILMLLMAVVFIAAFNLLAEKTTVFWRVVMSLALVVCLASMPLMAEPVAWVSARFEIISALFVMLGVSLYCFLSSSVLQNVSLGGFFFLALLSKESAAPLLVLFPFALALRDGRGSGRRFWLRFNSPRFWRPVVSLAVAFCLYLILRVLHFDGVFTPVNVFDFYAPMEHFRLVFESIAQYLDILFRPWIAPPPYYVVDFSQPRSSSWWGSVVAGFAVVCLLSVAAIQYGRGVLFIPLMFFVWLLPVINVLPIFPGLFSVAPRYLVLPVLMTVFTILLLLPARVSRLFCALFVGLALVITICAVPANRAFVHQFETNERFWDVLVARFGVYHKVVAVNAITSKIGMSDYDTAHERFVVAREKLDLGEAFIDRQVAQLAYGRGTVDDVAREVVRRKMDEWFSGVGLLSLGVNKPLLESTGWLNIAAFILVYDCRPMDEVYRINSSSLSIEADVAAQIVLMASTNPLLFSLAGYPLEQFDSPFKREQGRELVRLLQRDLKRCGIGYFVYDGL